MSKKMASNLVALALRIHNKVFKKSPEVSIVDELTRVQSVVVLMPDDPEQFKAAKHSVIKLTELKPSWQMTIIGRQEHVKALKSRKFKRLISYAKEDINFLGLPKSTFRQKIQKFEFDLALDLNLNSDIFTIGLFHLTNTVVKVSFDSKEKAPFFNLSIRVNPSEPMDKKYDAMIKYITIIANSKRPAKLSV
jgi:ADP-heptose:LPS heptosyltransferase